MSRRWLSAFVAALAVWLVAGCGGSNTTGGSSTSGSQTTSSVSTSTASLSGSPQPPAGAATFDVTLSHGHVTPTNATWQAKVGQPIAVRVTSDAEDELHVHSTPDHEFEVAAVPNQLFTFTIDHPGSVDVELHKLDKTIATIQVEP